MNSALKEESEEQRPKVCGRDFRSLVFIMLKDLPPVATSMNLETAKSLVPEESTGRGPKSEEERLSGWCWLQYRLISN